MKECSTMNWEDFEEKAFSEVYNHYINLTNDLVEEDQDPLLIAAILVSTGLSMYRTLLNEHDYDKIVEQIVLFKDDMTSFEQAKKGQLH
jgi:hypothetical protein